MKDIIKMQSETYKTFSNPARLHIVKLHCENEMNASELIKETGVSKANLSQHMGILVQHGVVNSRKEGVHVYYSISDAKIRKACLLMQEFLVDSIKKKNAMIDRAM